MSHKTALGGNAKKVRAAAKVEFSQKCAMAVVPVPRAPAQPRVSAAGNLEEALTALGVKFNLKLRRLDGSSDKETIAIRSLEDFDEAGLVRQSSVLREQKCQMDFLHDFQYELNHNPAFREELQEFIAGGKMSSLVTRLRAWRDQCKKREPEFLKFLRS